MQVSTVMPVSRIPVAKKDPRGPMCDSAQIFKHFKLKIDFTQKSRPIRLTPHSEKKF